MKRPIDRTGSEHEMQVNLFICLSVAKIYGFSVMRRWVESPSYKLPTVPSVWVAPELGFIHAVPNGGSRGSNPYEARKAGAAMKAAGQKAGVPDITCPYPNGGYNGMFIELKTNKGRVSTEQETFHAYLSSVGYRVVICRSWQSALNEIETYYG